MKKWLLILLFIFMSCDKRDEVVKECVESHEERRTRVVFVGKISTIQSYTANVCDYEDFVLYDDTGAAWRVTIVKDKPFYGAKK